MIHQKIKHVDELALRILNMQHHHFIEFMIEQMHRMKDDC